MLHGYHRAPDKGRKQGRSQQHLGIELELVGERKHFRDSLSVMAATVEKALIENGFPSRLFVVETDASLHSGKVFGVEVIFRPLGRQLFRHLPWKALFHRFRQDGKILLGHERAGLHFHTDRKPGDCSLYTRCLWHNLLSLSDLDKMHLFGRASNNYCNGGPGSKFPLEVEKCESVFVGEDDCGDDIFEDLEIYVPYEGKFSDAVEATALFLDYADYCRYVPLNIKNHKTYEFRAFASPEHGAQILAAGNFVLELLHPEAPKKFLLPDVDEWDAEDLFSSMRERSAFAKPLLERGWAGLED